MTLPSSFTDMRGAVQSKTQEYITKRQHKKSRAGCEGCKRRKIKCDESQPKCTFCRNRNLKCVYPKVPGSLASGFGDSSNEQYFAGKCYARVSAHSHQKVVDALTISNKPAQTLSSTGMSGDELRLMYHFTTVTSGTVFEPHSLGERVAQSKLPRLALQHNFMMHCILGIASLHLHKLQPEQAGLQIRAVAHRINALSGLRQAISHPSKDNFQAILATSLSMLILTSDRCSANPGELWIVSWFALWAGMREMIRLISWEFLEQSGLSPMFAKDDRCMLPPAILPTPLAALLATMDTADASIVTITNVVNGLGRLYERLSDPRFGIGLNTAIIAWPANIDIHPFATLLHRMQPQALVIAAYYLVFTKLTRSAWWMDGVSDAEIEAIAAAVPQDFRSFMLIPLQAVRLQNREDIVEFLLAQLPSDSGAAAYVMGVETGKWDTAWANGG